MPRGMEPDFVVMPAAWPDGPAAGVRPGDVAQFVPQGLAMGPPLIVTPYSGAAEPGFYGGQGTITHPVKSAPLNDDAGGVIYFSRHMEPAGIVAALDHIGFRSGETNYALFLAKAEDPRAENFLEQMRIVSHAALAHFFRCDPEGLAAQTRNAGEAVERFMAWQGEEWDDSAMAGMLGGDGDWAKERLAFGAMVENSTWGVWRIWSRAWLVTK